MKIYMVMFDWSTSDERDIEIEVFSSYSKAFAYFNELIENEKNPKMSWVGSEAINENGEINEYYEFSEKIETDGALESDCYWEISEMYDGNVYSYISLKVMEVQ